MDRHVVGASRYTGGGQRAEGIRQPGPGVGMTLDEVSKLLRMTRSEVNYGRGEETLAIQVH